MTDSSATKLTTMSENPSESTENLVRLLVQKVLLSHPFVALHEGQDHSNLSQTEQFSSIYHHIHLKQTALNACRHFLMLPKKQPFIKDFFETGIRTLT